MVYLYVYKYVYEMYVYSLGFNGSIVIIKGFLIIKSPLARENPHICDLYIQSNREPVVCLMYRMYILGGQRVFFFYKGMVIIAVPSPKVRQT